MYDKAQQLIIAKYMSL